MSFQPKYGICHLSIIPVRSEPSDKSELCTQLLFGDAYIILDVSECQKWYYIKIELDQYQGWIDAYQFYEVSQYYFTQYQKNTKYFNLDILTYLQNNQHSFPILLGSMLPFYQDTEVNLEGLKYTFQSDGSIFQVFDNENFISVLSKYLHAPYLWGGKSPLGLDCSGFVQMVFRFFGYLLPRDAYQQIDAGQEIPYLKETQLGDLAFFEREGRIIHVGIVLDELIQQKLSPVINYKLPSDERFIIHAFDTIRIDKLDLKGIYNLDRDIYTHKLSQLKRIISL